MLKKQTVWLLTMLSLVVVLSVYYITTPEEIKNDVAMTGAEKAEKAEAAKEAKKDGEAEVTVEEAEDGTVVSVSNDELFATIRMQLEDSRNAKKESLEDIVASKEASAAEKSAARDEMNAIDEAVANEEILETFIKSNGYDDALVRIEGEKVKVTVKAKESSASEANKIIQLVRSEMKGMEDVAVTLEPSNQ
ncbi:SpoIIIAH-like family protein [Metabacillus indicus]|uniref:SpoIIIAH-like family protein n=1 Tax=Metabacillus indicus TaxID=246786 RepID=UPI002A04DE28|nr:SpoIIIAH-like family protein [Metabacillus indicus]MDX8291098.1 SpoIIIAH-like family protein [Metabacillus indicus]